MYTSSNIKIGITTCKEYKDKTLPIILDSLQNSRIPNDDIVVFLAGYDNCYEEIIAGIQYRYLNFNSFELSSAIDIVDNNLVCDYWFLMHDTCKVGKKFKESIYETLDNNVAKIALKKRPSMNIGLYSYEYLASMKNKIINLKNKNYSEEGLNACKIWHVQNEDYLLWLNGDEPKIYQHNEIEHIYNDNWYGTETQRLTEYYSSIDLYKNKANWQASDKYTIKV